LAIFESNTPEYFAPGDRVEFASFLDDPAGAYFVCALRDGRVVGCGGYYLVTAQRLAGLTWGMVHREVQRQGIGGQLLQFRLSDIRRMAAVEKVRVRTTHLSEAFFRQFGFIAQARNCRASSSESFERSIASGGSVVKF
jgi:N-acetylglutamate synthase-like GNAT family acetyltransferase